MKLKIAAKIGIGYGIMTLALIINALLTNNALRNNREVNQNITDVYTPSLEFINDLYSRISDSRMLIKSWVFIDKISDTPDKLRLKSLHEIQYPELHDTLQYYSQFWSAEQKETLGNIDAAINDTLFPLHNYVMEQLSSFESYDDPFIVFEVTPMTEEGGDIMVLTQKILDQISSFQQELEEITNKARAEMVKSFDNFRTFIFLMGFGMVLAAIIIGYITIQSLVNPINNTKNILLQMSKGILPEDNLKEGSDETGQMAKALNMLIRSLKEISNFAIEIGKGNFKSEFQPLSEDDALGNSLLEMREELNKASNEEEKRKVEDSHRNWASQGVAQFSDILRKNVDDIEELSYNIISNLVQYTNSNQGGIFILNDNDPGSLFLEMTACYAFDRRKFLEKKIEIGEGLVGRCYQEKEKIYLTDIPKDYIKITSGLGEDNPKSLLLVPLIYNDLIYGIIEIASLNQYQEYEIEFIERIAEIIAATISTAKSNIQTTILLEKSQQQAEEMAAQEEEMRQNMEEMQATQEELQRKQESIIKIAEEVFEEEEKIREFIKRYKEL
ncbi:MAG: GAF domain-containing protein [Bacteroidales bacterium]|nr:GAF domain-containing protein [Bacteroidales bacterium]